MNSKALPNGLVELQTQTPELIPIAKIKPSPFNRKIDMKDIPELAASIKAQGLLQPVTVRQVDGHYELVFGERRLRACETFTDKIPAVVRELDDRQAHEMTLTENLQREDLPVLEQSACIAALISEGNDAQAIADRMGKSVQWVARRAKLQNLSAKWLKELQGDLSAWSGAHMELIARFDKKMQDSLIEGWHDFENSMTVKELDEYLQRNCMHTLSAGAWDKSDETLIKGVGACNACPNRSSQEPNLFGTESKPDKHDRCLNTECWRKKSVAFIEKRAEEMKEAHPDLVLLDNDPYSSTLLSREDSELKRAAINHNRVIECKKTDTGAKPALIIDGAGAGTMKYVTTAVSKGGSGKTVAGKKTMKEKRAQLEKRRAIAFIGKVVQCLHELFKKPVAIPEKQKPSISDLVAAFGATPLRKSIDAGAYDDPDPFKAKVPAESDGVVLLKGILPNIRADLLGEINRYEPETKNAETVCKWFAFDAAGMHKAVLEEIPEPKAWASQGKEEKVDKPATPKKKRGGGRVKG